MRRYCLHSFATHGHVYSLGVAIRLYWHFTRILSCRWICLSWYRSVCLATKPTWVFFLFWSRKLDMCNRHSHKLCPSCSFVFSALDNAIVSCPFHTVMSRTFPFCSILWPCANVKVKGSLVYPRKGREGSEMGSRYSFTVSVTSAQVGDGWWTPRPSRSCPRKETGGAGWAPGPVWMGAENLEPDRDSIPGPSSP